MKSLSILIAVTLAFILAAPPQAVAQAADVARFRLLRSEGVAAAGSNDLGLAARKFAEAASIVPGHPGVLLWQARVAAASGRPADAVSVLRRYADLGLFADLTRDPALREILPRPDYADVATRMSANRQPVGEPSGSNRDTAVRLLEGLAWSEAGGRLLVSSIRERTIFARSEDGSLLPWLAGTQALGVYGLAADNARDRLWAAASGSAEAGVAEADSGRAELLEIELSSGRVVARHAPPFAPRRNFGDVAVAPDGAVVVSDSTNGDVFLLRPGASSLESLVLPGVLGSPQGMAFSDDGTVLLLADYGSGLYRVEIATGAITPIAPPGDMTFISIDGVARGPDGSVWAVQNGISPNRLVRLVLAPDWRSVIHAEVRAANLADMDQPSGLTVHDDGVLVIQQSQWGMFDETGAPRADRNQAAVISTFPLTITR